MTPQRHLGSALPQSSKILPPPSQVQQCKDAPICPSHPQHMKVLKHFIYIQYGCGMQSVGVYCLNHDTTTSFGLCFTPIFQNLAPTVHRYNSVRVHPVGYPQHMKVLKHFIHIQYGCGIQSVGVYSLNHDTTSSLGLHLTPIFQNLAPTSTSITV
jgi:hypothetical protein